MRINHNIQALNTYRQLSQNQSVTSKHLEKLSSGLRINRASDDAAGLAISEKMRSQIKGLTMAERNALDGISLIQTAEGALNETNSMLQRMRELAVQAANDTMTDSDRLNIQKEVNQLADEINRIGNTTNYNTRQLLNGDVSANVATPARIVGEDLGSEVVISNAATSGKATGEAITIIPIDIHGNTYGSVTGSIDLDDSTLATLSPSLKIDNTNNELSFTIDGISVTAVIDISGGDLTFDGSSGQTSEDLKSAVQTAIDDALSSEGSNKTAQVDILNGKLTITDTTLSGDGANSKITIDGGGAETILFGSATPVSGKDAKNTLTFKIDNGSPKTITLAPNSYTSVQDLVDALNAGGDPSLPNPIADVTFSLDGNAIVATSSNNTGAASTISDFGGSAADILKLQNATEEPGNDPNYELQIKVNDETVVAQIQVGTYTDLDLFATAVQSAINSALSGTGESVKVTQSNGNLTIEDNKTGSDSSVTITNNRGATASQIAAAAAIGFTNSTLTDTSDTGSEASGKPLELQIGANEGEQLKISIDNMRAAALGLTHTVSSTAAITGIDGESIDVKYSSSHTITNNGITEYVLDISTHEAAEHAISVIDNAITVVTTQRANLGAIQNRLEHTISNLGATNENLTASESRIRDTDMALEMAEFTKNNIINQAATAMLAQANQLPQGILQLLK